MNLQYLLDEYEKTQAKIDEINSQKKAFEEDLSQLESNIQRLMADSGIEKAGTDTLSVWVSHEMAPKAIDWEAIFDWVEKTGNRQLIQRRISATAYKELVSSGVVPAGTEQSCFDKLKFRRKGVIYGSNKR